MNAPDPSVLHDTLPLVLVVDDEARSLDAIRRNLEEFRVLTAASADEARGLLEQHEVSVILCDQRMPGTTGVRFLKEVRELWPDTVRIIISGYTDSQDIIAGINEAGIYQYVLKPWVPEHLLPPWPRRRGTPPADADPAPEPGAAHQHAGAAPAHQRHAGHGAGGL
jgi:two-component system response regulator HupR/HoxA